MCTKANLIRALEGKDAEFVEMAIQLSELRKAVNEINEDELRRAKSTLYPYMKSDGRIVLSYKQNPLILSWFDWKDVELLSQLSNPLTRVLDFLGIRYDDTRDRGQLLRIFGTEDDLYDIVEFCYKLFPGMIGGKYSSGTRISDGRPFYATRTHQV